MFVFVPYSVAGHVHPMLPVLAELASRGHRVRVLTGDDHVAAVRETGAEAIRLAVVPEVYVPERLSVRYVAGRPRRIAANRQAARVLDGQLRAADGPCVLVVDPMLGWADRVARRHRGRVVTFGTTFHQGAAALAALAAEDRLPVPGWVHRFRPLARRYRRPGRLVLANSVAELQPAAEALPPDVRLVGPLVRPAPGSARPSGDRILFVSPGTVFARGPEFFDRFVRAFADRPWQVFLATGHLDPGELGPLPPNVVAARFLPQRQLLAHSDVFVTHAGMNSVTEALLAGVPMVLFPRSAEQRHLARQLVARGVGVWPGDLGPAALFDLVGSLAGNPAVRAWQSRLDPVAAARLAADLLETCAAQPGGREVGGSEVGGSEVGSRPAV